MKEQDYVDLIKREYSYLNDIDIHITYLKAKEFLLNALFPFDDSKTEVPSRYEMTLLEGMEKIIDLGNMRNFESYSENGVSWKLFNPSNLYPDILPYAG